MAKGSAASSILNAGWTDPSDAPLYPLSHPKVGIADALAASEQVTQRLRLLSDSIGPAYIQNQFYRRVRVKEQASLREKVKRKQQGGQIGQKVFSPRPLYTFRDITDLVGFRIVTLYDDDLKTAKDHVLDLVAVGQREPEPLFVGDKVWDAFREAHFYQRQEFDIYEKCSAELKERITEDCRGAERRRVLSLIANIKAEPEDEQYSSAHLIFDAVAYFRGWRLTVPVEFQLRTAIEDIWAEVNHKLIYKIRSPYVWSRQFQSSYDQALSASSALKAATIAYPKVIDPFLRSSKTAQEGLDYFDDPDVNTHFSLCMALFLAIGTGRNAHFEKMLVPYEKYLREFMQMPTDGKRADRLFRAMGPIRGIIEELEKDKTRTNDHVDSMLIDQRMLLCKLELLRLEILINVRCRYRIINNRLTFVGKKSDREKWESCCADAYKRLCDYRSNPEPLVRPVAMVHFWKFWIAQVFDPRVARKNIENAYEELKYDLSLPSYSIYRVLIPRMLAVAILYDVGDSVKTFRHLGSDVKTMHGLSGDMKADLVNAMRYAFEAYAISRISHEYRGDLLFGRELIDEVIDAVGILNIYSYFFKTFDLCITESKQISVAEVSDVVDFLKSKKKLINRLGNEVRQEIQETLKDTVEALRRAQELLQKRVVA